MCIFLRIFLVVPIFILTIITKLRSLLFFLYNLTKKLSTPKCAFFVLFSDCYTFWMDTIYVVSGVFRKKRRIDFPALHNFGRYEAEVLYTKPSPATGRAENCTTPICCGCENIDQVPHPRSHFPILYVISLVFDL